MRVLAHQRGGELHRAFEGGVRKVTEAMKHSRWKFLTRRTGNDLIAQDGSFGT